MCYRAATSVAIFLFWVEIRNRTQAIGFNRYNKLINAILCGDNFGKYDPLDVKDNDMFLKYCAKGENGIVTVNQEI